MWQVEVHVKADISQCYRNFPKTISIVDFKAKICSCAWDRSGRLDSDLKFESKLLSIFPFKHDKNCERSQLKLLNKSKIKERKILHFN